MKSLTLFPEVFSDSMLSSLYNCELKWFRINCQKYGSWEKNPDLIAGGHFATACEITRKAVLHESMDIEDAIALGEEYILEGEDTNHPTKTNDIIADRFRKYFKHYPIDRSYVPVKLENGEYAIEYTLITDLPILHPETGKPLQYKCKLDTIMEKLDTFGKPIGIYIHDEKTTDKLSRIAFSKDKENPNGLVDIAKETDRYAMSSQLISYAWACQSHGIKVDGAIITRVPLATNYEYPIKIQVDISSYQINLWYNSFISRISELVGKYIAFKKGGDTPFKYFRADGIAGGNCENYGRMCSFAIGCTNSLGEAFLDNSYQPVKVWDRELHEESLLETYIQKLNLQQEE